MSLFCKGDANWDAIPTCSLPSSAAIAMQTGFPNVVCDCSGPMSYKDFMLRLSDDVTPEGAQAEYQKYLAQYWGSETRAEFQQKQNQDWCAVQPPWNHLPTGLPSECSGGRPWHADVQCLFEDGYSE